MSMQSDIIDFRTKFNLPIPHYPHHISADVFRFRVGHLEEELDELREAFSNPKIIGNDMLAEMADALVDLCYVAVGTAVGMGINFEACWDEVHRVNMTKERANSDGSNSKRGHSNDIVKPPGWTPPDIHTTMFKSMSKTESILLSAHQIIDQRSEEGHRQYGSVDTNCDDAATIASTMQGKDFTTSDVLAVLVGLKLARHRHSYKQDNLLDAVAYLGALDNLIQGRGDDR